MKKYLALQFDGEGATGAAESGTQETGTPEAKTEVKTEGEKDPEEVKPEKLSFKDLLKSDPEYKAAYDDSVKRALDSRFKGYDKLQEDSKRFGEVANLIHDAYPDLPADADVVEYLRKNAEMYAAAAAEAGMPVDSYMRLKAIERQNAELEGERQAQQEAERRNLMFQSWREQETAMVEQYPGFSLADELENPMFLKYVDMGMPIEQAFRTVHFDEIMSGAIASAQQKTARTIKSGQARPVENGAGGAQGGIEKLDPSKLTDEQIDEINRRVMNGELVSF